MTPKVKQVDSYWYVSRKDFQEYVSKSRSPLLVRNLDVGVCTSKWSVKYLSEALGPVDVQVHVSPAGRLSFIEKNFKYKTLPFDEFVGRASRPINPDHFFAEDEKYYLRSIGPDKRGKSVADLRRDFPSISGDVRLPDLFDQDSFFSSILRVGSEGLQMWTHYDVMDNALIQVVGRKRVTLFKPSDARFMYLRGDKSEVLDIDNVDMDLYSDFLKATRYQCVLNPGDVLYIPALWFHNTLSLTFSVGVNVFWKHLSHELYDKSDTYGNKDVIPAAKALELVKKARKLLDLLPPDHQDFYTQRAILELESGVIK